MTDIPEELVERVSRAICIVDCGRVTENELSRCADLAQAAIRAVLDWQAKEWVEIPRLDRP